MTEPRLRGSGWLRLLGAAPLLTLLAISTSGAQQQPPPSRGHGWPGHRNEGPPQKPMGGPPLDELLHAGPPGRWWNDAETAQRLGLTEDQRKRMDSTFQQSRVKLIDLSAQLQKDEDVLESLLQADRPDQARAIAQLDRVADSRAGLEKASGRMLLNLRSILTPDQWKKLETLRPAFPPDHGGGERSRPPRPTDDGRGRPTPQF